MQTSYSNSHLVGRAGMIADNRAHRHIQTRISAGRINAGRGVFRVPSFGQPGTRASDPGQVYHNPTPVAAADVDAILATGGATTATVQVFEGTELNGIIGTGEMFPARAITLVMSSHADWNATTATLRGVNHLGQTVNESLSIPNGGNATVTSTGFFKSVISLTIPAQESTGGTFTIGVAAIDASVTLADFEGVAVYNAGAEPYDTVGSDAAEIGPEVAFDCLYKGAIWVVTEDACSAGGTAHVRVTATAGTSELIGSFRSDTDGGEAIAITGARYLRDSGVGGLNIVELY